MRAFPLLVVMLLPLAGAQLACVRPVDERPEATYTAFAHAVQKEEDAAAFALLSSATRERLEARASELSKASGGTVPADAAKLFFSSLHRAPPLQEVHPVRVDSDHATLSVRAGGQEGDVQLVREQGSWRVDLTETLR